jgi:hypothetical protein
MRECSGESTASGCSPAAKGWASPKPLLIFGRMAASISSRAQRPLRRLGAAALGCALALVVSGCESLDFLRSSEPEAPPQAAPRAPAPQPAEPPRVRLAPPAAPRPAPQPLPDVKLVGLSQPETETLLGPPTAASDRPPAKVWEYRAGDCTLDVYFYLDVGRNAFYALHYDSPTLNSSGAPATASVPDAADRCLRRVYNAHRQP